MQPAESIRNHNFDAIAQQFRVGIAKKALGLGIRERDRAGRVDYQDGIGGRREQALENCFSFCGSCVLKHWTGPIQSRVARVETNSKLVQGIMRVKAGVSPLLAAMRGSTAG